MDTSAIGTIVGAAIGAIAVISTWYGTQLWERRTKRLADEQDVRDLMAALYAEILINVEFSRAIVTRKYEESLIRRIEAFERGTAKKYRVFGGETAANFVFDEVRQKIERLPARCIGAVVLFYKIENIVNTLNEQITSAEFQSRPTGAKIDTIRGYHDAARHMVEIGDGAAAELATQLPESITRNIRETLGFLKGGPEDSGKRKDRNAHLAKAPVKRTAASPRKYSAAQRKSK
ncbi:MAG: hypothetical protein ACREDU_11510 [Methylocella sp.]